MPLPILLPLVVFGIGGIVILIRWMRPTAPLVLTEETAIAVWGHRNPELPAKRIHLNTIGSHGLVDTENGPGLVWVFGADPVTRVLDHPIKCTKTDLGLRLHLSDFTVPAIDIPLRDGVEKAEWAKLLGAMV